MARLTPDGDWPSIVQKGWPKGESASLEAAEVGMDEAVEILNFDLDELGSLWSRYGASPLTADGSPDFSPVDFIGQYEKGGTGLVRVTGNNLQKFELSAGNWVWTTIYTNTDNAVGSHQVGPWSDTEERFTSLFSQNGRGYLFSGDGSDTWVWPGLGSLTGGEPHGQMLEILISRGGAKQAVPVGYPRGVDVVGALTTAAGGTAPTGYYAAAYTIVYKVPGYAGTKPYYLECESNLCSLGWCGDSRNVACAGANKLRVPMPALTTPVGAPYEIVGRNVYLAYDSAGAIPMTSQSYAALFRWAAFTSNVGAHNVDIAAGYTETNPAPPFGKAIGGYRDHSIPPWHHLFMGASDGVNDRTMSHGWLEWENSDGSLATLQDFVAHYAETPTGIGCLHSDGSIWVNTQRVGVRNILRKMGAGDPNICAQLDWLQVGSAYTRFTAMRSVLGCIAIWKPEGLYLMTGTSPETYRIRGPLSRFGSIMPNAIVEDPAGVFWWWSPGYGWVKWDVGVEIAFDSEPRVTIAKRWPKMEKQMRYGLPTTASAGTRGFSYYPAFSHRQRLFHGYRESSFGIGPDRQKVVQPTGGVTTYTGERAKERCFLIYQGAPFQTQAGTGVRPGSVIAGNYNGFVDVWHDEDIERTAETNMDGTNPFTCSITTGAIDGQRPDARKLWNRVLVLLGATNASPGKEATLNAYTAGDSETTFTQTNLDNCIDHKDTQTRSLWRILSKNVKRFVARQLKIVLQPGTGTGAARHRIVSIAQEMEAESHKKGVG